jgi:hypothetical protein
MKPFTTIAVAVFAIMALAHLFRLVSGFEVAVDGKSLPIWASAIGLVVAGTLAMMVWRESRRA